MLQTRFPVCDKETLGIQARFPVCDKETPGTNPAEKPDFLGAKMIQQGVYFFNADLKQFVLACGGQWSDVKVRPMVCLIKSSENEDLYWAIPMGDMDHRTEEQRSRIQSYIDLPHRDIRSCYYHIGKTDKESLFFISDAIPVVERFVDRPYKVGNVDYIIKNPKLIEALKEKLTRILVFERGRPNYFRQHITDVKTQLLKEINNQK